MQIDKTLLQKMAQLAHLEVNEQNEAKLLEGLNKIVGWAEKLQEVDTTGVSPLITLSSETNIYQEEDIPQPPLAHKKGLANAPSKDSNYFRVPQQKA
jgi:aspartyl-tRNA(Asn)/glutamyl-tRNA(Gln) amidotransferase subunit C